MPSAADEYVLDTPTVRSFIADVRDAMRQREAELRAGTGFDGSLGRGEENPPTAQGQSQP